MWVSPSTQIQKVSASNQSVKSNVVAPKSYTNLIGDYLRSVKATKKHLNRKPYRENWKQIFPLKIVFHCSFHSCSVRSRFLVKIVMPFFILFLLQVNLNFRRRKDIQLKSLFRVESCSPKVRLKLQKDQDLVRTVGHPPCSLTKTRCFPQSRRQHPRDKTVLKFVQGNASWHDAILFASCIRVNTIVGIEFSTRDSRKVLVRRQHDMFSCRSS